MAQRRKKSTSFQKQKTAMARYVPVVSNDLYGNILMEFRYFNTKAGYFRLDIIDGKIIIRTFLFVTNNGTPEGQKLGSNTGLQKLDKKYLAIDKLSTFMTSDIGKNENVKKIFIDAGCQCLLELYERSHSVATNTPKHFDSELMLKYIDYERKYFPELLKQSLADTFSNDQQA